MNLLELQFKFIYYNLLYWGKDYILKNKLFIHSLQLNKQRHQEVIDFHKKIHLYFFEYSNYNNHLQLFDYLYSFKNFPLIHKFYMMHFSYKDLQQH